MRNTREVDENGITHVLEREYFSTGELKTERRGAADEEPYVMHYEYSRQARLLNYIDVLGQRQTYTYNPRAQLVETRLGNTHSTFTYDDLARVKAIRTVDGDQALEITIGYDDFEREILRTFDFGQGTAQTLTQVYDEADRLTRRTLQQGSNLLRDETYDYDERGRLVDYRCEGSECPVDPYGKTIIGQLFGFDEKDNLTYLETTFDGGRHSIYFEYNNEDPCQLSGLENELRPPRPGDPVYPPRIDFHYDANGNLLNDEAGRLLGYDSLSRLISVSALSGESPSDYRYDSLDTLSGSRSDSGNEQRFYQNGDLANLVKGADSSTFVRAEGVVLAEHQEGASPKSLLLASNESNSVLCELSRGDRQDLAYTPYGYSFGGEGALGYNGEQREAQDGRYLLGKGYRAFNPTLMRFHSPDSWSPFGEGGLNGYAYVSGNPVGYTDPTGHMPFGKAIVTAAESALQKLANNTAKLVAEEAAEAAARASSAAAASTSKVAAGQADTVVKGLGGSLSSTPSSSAYDIVDKAQYVVMQGDDFVSDWVVTGGFNHRPVKLDIPQSPGYINQSARGQMPLPPSAKPVSKPARPQPQAPLNSKSKQEIRAEARKTRHQQMKAQRKLDRENGDRWQ